MTRCLSPFWLGVVLAAVLVPTGLSAGETTHPHGTKADYDRARGLRRLTGKKVFKASVHPHWFAGGSRFWYRNDLAKGARAFVVVDAEQGTRRPAFDHTRLAAAFTRALGDKVTPTQLPVARIDFRVASGSARAATRRGDEKGTVVFLFAKGGWWRCDLTSYDLRKLNPGERATPSLPALRRPHRSKNKGGETYVTFTNHTQKAVDLFWVDFGGDRKAYGSIEPGAERSQHTFAGHVWVAVQKGEVIAAFEATEEPRTALIAEQKRPAAKAGLASAKQGKETHITFLNRTKAAVRMFWVDTKGKRKPFAKIKPGGRQRQHTFAGHVWIACDTDGRVLATFEATEEGGPVEIRALPGAPTKPQKVHGTRSPDGRWAVFIRGHNVRLRDLPTGSETALTGDGSAEDAYRGPLLWSPDSRRLAVVRRKPAGERKVHAVESSPKGQLQPKLHSWNYPKPGDRIAHPRPCLFDVPGKRRIPVSEELFNNPWAISRLRWDSDGRHFTFLYNQRGHQVLRVVKVDAETGAARALIDETSTTFVDYSQKLFYRHLEGTSEIIWMSERDGWNHLYLYDARTGKVKNRITRGRWVVRGVDRVDVEKRRVWFRAVGIHPDQDPYHIHYARVDFDGSRLTILTEGDGTHRIKFSPDRRFFLDTWSRVDLPPVTELRRSQDGKRLCELERADWSALKATGWRPPERFVAKGRDGMTDIFGVIHRPMRFDPQRKYPAIESIYAGPHGTFAPTAFRPFYGQQELAELGFIVVQIDGMGTNWRSRKFHDVCWKNIGDGGFPDRIRWIKAVAARYPEVDATRVGIYGGSAGGQNALRALLVHGDFYKAGAADCGCHDNRMDKIWWNEAWMGWPIGPHYEEQSNVTQAHRLQGKLLLTVGELDRNVDPASTMQVVSALIKADKDFELVIIPGAGHGCGESPYGKRRRADFFVRHLLRVEPRAQ